MNASCINGLLIITYLYVLPFNIMYGSTYPHTSKSGKLSYSIIDELRGERLAVLFKLFALKPPAKLLNRDCGINNFVFPHEHNPINMLEPKR